MDRRGAPTSATPGSAVAGPCGLCASGSSLPEVIETCSQIISSGIAEHIRRLGGNQYDVAQIAQSATFAVLSWSVGQTFGH